MANRDDEMTGRGNAAWRKHTQVLSVSSDEIVVQAEATGPRSALLAASLILGISGIVALSGFLVPAIGSAGVRLLFGVAGALMLLGAVLAAAFGYRRFSPPVVTFYRGKSRVEVREASRSELIEVARPAFGTSRFATHAGLHMVSLHLNLETDRSLVLATAASGDQALREMSDHLEWFLG